MEDRHQKFCRLATARVNSCLKQMRLIQNLSNRNNYDWSEQEARKVISALRSGIEEIEKSFKDSPNKKKPFSL